MKKFTNLNESVSTPQNPTTIKDVLIKVMNETLSVQTIGSGSEDVQSSITGGEEFVSLVEKLIEVQNVKQTIQVLESIKANSLNYLDMNWINEAIDFERNKIK